MIKSLKALRDALDRPLRPTTYFMNKQEWEDILKYEDPIKYHRENLLRLAKQPGDIDIRTYLLNAVKTNNDVKALIQVITEEFPQHKELLEKMLLLK